MRAGKDRNGRAGRCGRGSARAGFTLIEALLASALTGLLIAAAAEAVTGAMLAKRNAELRLDAAALASSRLETLKGLPPLAEELAEGFHAADAPGPGGRLIYRLHWTVTALPEGLRRVEMAAQPPGSRRLRVACVLYLSGDLGFAP